MTKRIYLMYIAQRIC